MRSCALALATLAAAAQLCSAQELPVQSPTALNRYGRWSLGLSGGGNMWVNDFDTRKVSPAGDLTLRYSLSRKFSLGIMGGYEGLQAGNTNSISPGHFALSNTYLAAKGFTGDLVAWYHFTYGETVSPYLYLGAGGFLYKRTAEGSPWPDDKYNTSLHIPAGIGLEVAVSRHAALALDLGVRMLDDHSDNFVGAGETGKSLSKTDWYPAARLGFNFYFGTSDDDDNDNDGLTNGEERMLGTDPNNPDTDGDGLTDGQEFKVYKTNPLKKDTDGDGLSDGEEVLKYHTDPLNPDTDGDGLSDGDEVLKYHTDPLKVDTDGDGLSDGDEVLKYHTDPLKMDTDGDGLSDGDEVLKYHTDPLKSDTDGGGVNDGQEITNGTNPLDPTDDIPKPKVQKIEVGKAIILEGIIFQTGKATIAPQSEQTLMQAFNTLKDNPEISVEIRGYTDNVGKAVTNRKLSQRRAESVRAWLIHKGIDSRRISAKGLGPETPIGDNQTNEGRAKNRRIEFYRMK